MMNDVFKAVPYIQFCVRIHRAALWILGEYCTTIEDIQSVMTEVRNLLGEIPIVDDEMKKAAGEDTEGQTKTTYFLQRCHFFRKFPEIRKSEKKELPDRKKELQEK